MILEARKLTIGYGKTLLKEMTFDVRKGECIMLCGANGSGKTTLMRTLAGTLPALGGEIITERNGRNEMKPVMIPSRIPKIQGFTLEEFIKTGLYNQTPWSGKTTEETSGSIMKAMEILGIRELASRDISKLSDGEFQKGCIAIGMVRKAGLILMDEPTAFLDMENRISVLSAIGTITRETGKSVIFSSHDIYEGLKACDRVLSIGKDGILRQSGSDKAGKILAIKSCLKNKNIIFDN
ncbi:MAG: ABC transporter ATP-binding protein [Bacteroidales bacterium]|jgi:iron complex transport system ATP-binding protein|nr:ABC transporter ATP-binding protein [Bacteroidales bacterium]